ncbi:hypothetical protein ACIQCF_03040 [Streptomyces sp. NPDC088353]|uniref:hypothetical protein n=1 Tax=unclassified Streptomyces TaxID=2593676 RepID=UPI00368C86D4
MTPGTPAPRPTVSGHAFGRIRVPLSGVPLDSWRAADAGAHDMGGYALRGHQFTDSAGAYAPSKIVPGLHLSRTRHLHVKAQAPGRPAPTTQPYFPYEPRNGTDALFGPALLTNVRGRHTTDPRA